MLALANVETWRWHESVAEVAAQLAERSLGNGRAIAAVGADWVLATPSANAAARATLDQDPDARELTAAQLR